MNSIIRQFVLVIFCAISVSIQGAEYPAPTEADYVIRDFKFTSGETTPELRIHYRTVDFPQDGHRSSCRVWRRQFLPLGLSRPSRDAGQNRHARFA